MATSTKLQDEIAIRFAKDRNDCIIVVFYEAHGSLVTDVRRAGLPAKAGGKDAIRLTGKVGELVKVLGLARKAFVANGHTYFSYAPAQTGQTVNTLA